ncbi:hypothetical protein ACWC5I_14760, partial [Kitasatospora sp. NPDC001574]
MASGSGAGSVEAKARLAEQAERARVEARRTAPRYPRSGAARSRPGRSDEHRAVAGRRRGGSP